MSIFVEQILSHKKNEHFQGFEPLFRFLQNQEKIDLSHKTIQNKVRYSWERTCDHEIFRVIFFAQYDDIIKLIGASRAGGRGCHSGAPRASPSAALPRTASASGSSAPLLLVIRTQTQEQVSP